jgi:transposase-like protein
MTSNSTVVSLRQPETIDDPLTAILRSGARRLLAQAIAVEADTFLATMKGARLPDGRERLVRCGSQRLVQTGIGPVEVRRVKLRDRGAGDRAERIRFTSAILPRWARRTPSLDAVLPILYLRGLSMGDFQEALAALLGRDAPTLSPSVITRLRGDWEADYARWQRRDLTARRYVYIWADGVYLQVRMEPQTECMLVLIGATPEGKKELVGFQVGLRESDRAGGSCWSTSRPAAWSSRPNWRPETAHLVSGRRPRKSAPRHGTSAAPCTKPPTCSTRCPSPCSRQPRLTYARSGGRRNAQPPRW